MNTKCTLATGLAVSCLTAITTEAAPPEYHDAVTSADPILWYQFDEASGNSINHGSLGASHDAVHIGATLRQQPTLAGDTGVGVTFGMFLESLGNSPLTGNPTFSIETVVYLPVTGDNRLYGPFLHWGDGAPGSRNGEEVYFSIRANRADQLYAGFYNAGVSTVDFLTLDRWYHVVWTREGGNNSQDGTRFFINGCEVAMEVDTILNPGFLEADAIDVTDTPFRINAGRDLTRNFTGIMDELALYDRVLTPEEIEERASLFRVCPGDCNQNGSVAFDDLVCMLSAFGCSNSNADCDGSGVVNFNDLVCALSFFGDCD